MCRTRSTVPERLSQIQISDGLKSLGSLPPLQCRGGWIHLNGMGYRDGVEIDRVQQDWQIIQTVELERYVASVVGAEMPSHWHPGECARAGHLVFDASDSTGIPAVSPWRHHPMAGLPRRHQSVSGGRASCDGDPRHCAQQRRPGG